MRNTWAVIPGHIILTYQKKKRKMNTMLNDGDAVLIQVGRKEEKERGRGGGGGVGWMV